jgi:hypothetical protein
LLPDSNLFQGPVWRILSHREGRLKGPVNSVKDIYKGSLQSLKGLSHKIFGPVFWAVWMYLGPNVNRFWFLNFNDVPLI